MFARGPFHLHRIPIALALFLSAFNSPLAPAQTFTIAAPAVTTDSAGSGLIQFTVSGIPFDGTLIIGCQYAGQSSYQSQARLPICGAGPVVGFPVTAGQTVTKTISLVPWGTPIPLALHGAPNKTHPVLASGFFVAGALFLGFGLRRFRRSWPCFFLVLLGALALTSGVSACGGSSSVPPAGTYPYTLTAGLTSSSPAILSAATSTTVQVTIP
jgi:hypothetical protein